MNDRFNGKVAVVTGAASGIGFAVAARLIKEGGRVALVDRSLEALSAATDGEEFPRANCTLHIADVGDADSVESLRESVLAAHERVDVLVNSAGILRWGGTVDTSECDWDDLMRVNLKGSWLVGRAFTTQMIRQHSGAIVNVASNMGTRGVANQVAYSVSKGGVIALTKSMAVELGPHGIRVNCVNPGHVQTPMGNSAAARLGLTEQGIKDKYPLGRIGVPEEVASTIAYAAAAEASFLTGAIIPVDGGYTA